MTLLEPIFWNWLVLAAFFLFVELISPSFFAFFLSLAAAIVAAISFIYPELSLSVQGICFALFALVNTIFWWKFVKKRWQNDRRDLSTQLNHPDNELIGRHFQLQTPIENGRGQLQINDSFWTIHGEDMPAGAIIQIDRIESLDICVSRVA